MADPVYRVQLFTLAATTYGVGDLVAEFENLKNVGWEDYLNDVPVAFFTIDQDDPKLASLRPYANKGQLHVRLYRDADLVFTGWLGEGDANHRDVVFYAFGYLGGLFWMTSDWAKTYQNAQIDTIVSDTWTRAKTTLSNSRLNFVATGTIEAPVTTSGGTTPIVLPTYTVFYKKLLNVLREMAALGRGNTTNSVVFEIAPSATPTFNFWKNRGVDRPDIKWEYGDARVAGFRHHFIPIFRRNVIHAAGSSPNDILLRQDFTDSADLTATGRLEEPVYFSWVRDNTELVRAGNQRLALAVRDEVDIGVNFFPNTVLPVHASGSAYRMSDRVKVKVDRGITNVDGYFQIVGCRVLWTRGAEYVSMFLQQRPGT